VSGELFQGHTGHHHTDALMDASAIAVRADVNCSAPDDIVAK
jgi:hypothetical protein